MAETDNPYNSPDSDPDPNRLARLANRRVQLLPIWIMSINWLFVLIALASMGFLVYLLLAGFGHYDEMVMFPREDFPMVLLIVVFLFILPLLLGFGAIGMLYGKPWGSTVALAGGVLALVYALAPIIVFLEPEQLYWRIDLVVLLPYVYRLYQIHRQWREAVIGTD